MSVGDFNVLNGGIEMFIFLLNDFQFILSVFRDSEERGFGGGTGSRVEIMTGM